MDSEYKEDEIIVKSSENDPDYQFYNLVHEEASADDTCDFIGTSEYADKYKALAQNFKNSKDNYINIVQSMPPELKQVYFYDYIKVMESIRLKSEKCKGKAIPIEKLAAESMREILNVLDKLTGYHASWVFKLNREAAVKIKTGRKDKYNNLERQVNNLFIQLLIEYGASQTQAIYLLARLRGEKVVNKDRVREIKNTFNEYKEIGKKESIEKGLNLLDSNLLLAANFMYFSADENLYQYEEKAYETALKACEELCRKLAFYVTCNNDYDTEELHTKWCKFKGSYIERFFNNPAYPDSKHERFLLMETWLSGAVSYIYHRLYDCNETSADRANEVDEYLEI